MTTATRADRTCRSPRNPRNPGRRQRPALAALLCCVLAAVLAGLGATPAAASGPPPQLSIAVDDGRTDAGAGADLTYTVTVTNLGARSVKELEVTQTVPAAAQLRSAGPGGTVDGQQVRWRTGLRQGQTKRFTSRVSVAGSVPDDLLRLAAVACAAQPDAGRPLVCASDSDQLPAGAAADARRATLTAAPVPVAHLPVLAVAGALLGVLVVAGLLLGRRRARRQPA